jgi:hypothetical protein
MHMRLWGSSLIPHVHKTGVSISCFCPFKKRDSTWKQTINLSQGVILLYLHRIIRGLFFLHSSFNVMDDSFGTLGSNSGKSWLLQMMHNFVKG